MKRVMIYGGSGSGKSTLAQKLGEITGLPVVHIDPMYWKPNWVQRDAGETQAMVLAETAKDEWVFDGNHHSTFPQRLARADHLVFLDIPTWLRLWRVVGRTVKYLGRPRPDMADGCPERFSWEFISVWVAGYYKRSQARDLEFLNSAPNHIKCYHIKRTSDLRQLYKDAAS